MADVIFSSWQGEIIDNRGKAREAYTPLQVKLPAEFEKDVPVKAFMGWDGIIVCDESVDIVDMCLKYAEAVQKESCGRCLPCRIGSKVMLGYPEKLSPTVRANLAILRRSRRLRQPYGTGPNARSGRPVLCLFCRPSNILPPSSKVPA